MKLQYPILIERGDDNTAWGVIVPDLPGCFSAADKQEDILDNAREAILLHLKPSICHSNLVAKRHEDTVNLELETREYLP